MHLLVYHCGQLVAIYTYGHVPILFGSAGQHLKAAIEAWQARTGIPLDWRDWAASIVCPALKAGLFVRPVDALPLELLDDVRETKPLRELPT